MDEWTNTTDKLPAIEVRDRSRADGGFAVSEQVSSEERIHVCEECNGDGGFDEPAAWTPTWIECRSCFGTGEVVVLTMTPSEADMWHQWAESLDGAIGI